MGFTRHLSPFALVCADVCARMMHHHSSCCHNILCNPLLPFFQCPHFLSFYLLPNSPLGQVDQEQMHVDLLPAARCRGAPRAGRQVAAHVSGAMAHEAGSCQGKSIVSLLNSLPRVLSSLLLETSSGQGAGADLMTAPSALHLPSTTVPVVHCRSNRLLAGLLW